MEIDVLQFDEKVGMGTFADWLTAAGWAISCWRCDRLEFPPADRRRPVLLLGGYMGVNDRAELPYLQAAADWVAAAVEGGLPLLAICLGGQLLAFALGAGVESQTRQEKGIREIRLTAAGESDPLFAGLPNPFLSFEWHNDSFQLPVKSTHLAATDICPGQAFRYKNAWGLQFHPEVNDQVVADWCQRTGAGEEPLRIFQDHRSTYLAHSQRLLENFLAASKQLLGKQD